MQPNNIRLVRRLRIPNAEIAELYRTEVVERNAGAAGGRERLDRLQNALVTGDAPAVNAELGRIVRDSTSCFDLTTENGCHMLLLGLCIGIVGYADPVSNREQGYGRPDIRIEPEASPFAQGPRPLLTIEVKFLKADETGDAALEGAARDALAQIAQRGYDEGELPAEATGRLRWGVAFGGRRVHAACKRPGQEGVA